jgi:prepilin-type N-terminal cleavage/methylation domain-containing protein
MNTTCSREFREPRRAVTLIELLVVLTLIAILALVAIPHVMDASVRSKVSRTRADLRTLATATECYRVDSNTYPDAAPQPKYKAGMTYCVQCLARLTTPVAYMSTPLVPDSFSRDQPLAYVNIRAQVEQQPSVIDLLAPGLSSDAKAELTRHEYTLVGVGPDGVFHNQLVGDQLVITRLGNRTDLSSEYDPSNGTNSPGDIARTALGSW